MEGFFGQLKLTIALAGVLFVGAMLAVTGCADQAHSRGMELDGVDSDGRLVARSGAAPTVDLDPELTRFAGRDPGLSPARDGGLHLAYVVEDAEARARVAYRFLPAGGPIQDAIWVSPPELEIGARGETPPVIVETTGGWLAIAYKVRLAGKRKGQLRVQQSRDRGATWSRAEMLHDDTDNYGAHSFLDGEATAAGAVFAWLDNRSGAQGLRVARLDADGQISANETVDPQTCQCCATAVHAEGERVWLAYRDLDDDVRDIALARSVVAGSVVAGNVRGPDGTGSLGFEPLGMVADDGWRIQGCPHTGPRLATGGDGALWIAWFSGSQQSGAQPGIYVAKSEDYGTSFSPRRALAAPGSGGLQAVFHPELARLADGRLALFYEATRADGRAIEIRIAEPAGDSWGEPLRFDEEGVYPRVAAQGDVSFLAYTLSQEGAERQVVIASVERLLAAARAPKGMAVTAAAG